MLTSTTILLDCDLTEELEWGEPCSTAGGGNIVIMQPSKAHLSLIRGRLR